MTQRLTFTLYHGFAASLILHSAIAVPFVLQRLESKPDETPLVIELQGAPADTQSEQQFLAQTQGATQQQRSADPTTPPVVQAAQPSPKPPPDVPAADEGTLPAPAKPALTPTPTPTPKKNIAANETTAGNSAETTPGAEQEQEAQTITSPPRDDKDRLDAYVRQLGKKIQGNLFYPAEARRIGLRGTATVSFTILINGQIRPNSLKIAHSSGEPRLDAGALQTIRESAPFAAPPEEMTISIALVFGRKR